MVKACLVKRTAVDDTVPELRVRTVFVDRLRRRSCSTPFPGARAITSWKAMSASRRILGSVAWGQHSLPPGASAFAYEAVRRGEIPSIRIGRRVPVNGTLGEPGATPADA